MSSMTTGTSTSADGALVLVPAAGGASDAASMPTPIIPGVPTYTPLATPPPFVAGGADVQRYTAGCGAIVAGCGAIVAC